MPVAARAIKRGFWASAASLFALRNDDNVVRALALPALRKGAARRQGERRSAAGASALEWAHGSTQKKATNRHELCSRQAREARASALGVLSCSGLTDRFMRIV